MERVTENFTDELSEEIIINGIKLVVIAKKMEEGQWQLSVLNESGIYNNWLEYFATGQLAIDEGKNAIENEGIESFMEIDGFEYLLN